MPPSHALHSTSLHVTSWSARLTLESSRLTPLYLSADTPPGQRRSRKRAAKLSPLAGKHSHLAGNPSPDAGNTTSPRGRPQSPCGQHPLTSRATAVTSRATAPHLAG